MGGSRDGSPPAMGERSSPGMEAVLFRTPGAQLHLVDGQKNILMAQGEFSVVLVKQKDGQLGAILGSIHEYHWPIAKDALTVKDTDQSYVFSLPDFAYRLVLASDTPSTALNHLETVLRTYGHVEHQSQQSASAPAAAAPGAAIATGASGGSLGLSPFQEQFQQAERRAEGAYTSPFARHISTGGELCCKCIEKGGELACVGIKFAHRHMKSRTVRCEAPAEVDLATARRIERAKRLSALAKSVSKLLLSGALTASETVAATVADAVKSSPALRPAPVVRDVAIASVDAFSKLLDTAEVTGKKVLSETREATADIVSHKYGDQAANVTYEGLGAAGNVVSTVWTLNKLGVKAFAKATAKATAVNVLHDQMAAEVAGGGSGGGGGGSAALCNASNNNRVQTASAPPFTTQQQSPVVVGRVGGANNGGMPAASARPVVSPLPPHLHPGGSGYSAYILPPTMVTPSRNR
ncbi:hypothetical protein CBR_g10814 [Chara braunii]|uniref:Senescence domain-containing protein n=1 Tax=Chara braunii TaxID=69332 RepID=A0A388KPE4_CHABU|nr:hypothetical protein CBR_g10814 [Chara braunii]|eukprot:GBG71878.1 hypothetical protein CBR_g10814 [Chara braunii]